MIGSIYYVSSFFLLFITGKGIVFSPIVGFPLTVASWPWMVYADLIHRQTLGLKIPTILTLVSVVAFVIYLSVKLVRGQVLRE